MTERQTLLNRVQMHGFAATDAALFLDTHPDSRQALACFRQHQAALAAAKALFISGGASADMPTTELSDDNFTDGKVALLDMLVLAKLAPSKGEVRRLVQQGGVSVNDVKANDFAESFDEAALRSGLIVKKGKKVFHKVVLE